MFSEKVGYNKSTSNTPQPFPQDVSSSWTGGGGGAFGSAGYNNSNETGYLKDIIANSDGHTIAEYNNLPFIERLFEDSPAYSGGAVEFGSGKGINLALKAAKNVPKLYEVYRLININSKAVEYVGKTSRGFMKRFGEHLLSPKKQEWIHEVKPFLYKGGLTKFEAMFYEQSLILRYKLVNLRNIINGVAEKNWLKYNIKK